MSALDPKYTFDRFVDGKATSVARAYAWHVACNPGCDFNPFTLYGDSGLGKTHLMHAIGHEMLKRNPKARVRYIGTERFCREVIAATKDRQVVRFRESFMELEALFIDDLCFMSGRSMLQRELVKVLKPMLWCSRQVVVCNDGFPSESGFNCLDKSLVSFLRAGLCVPLDAPTFEHRVEIVKGKAERYGIGLPPEVAQWVAKAFASNVREMEGTLNRLRAGSRLTGQAISVEFARETLSDLLRGR